MLTLPLRKFFGLLRALWSVGCARLSARMVISIVLFSAVQVSAQSATDTQTVLSLSPDGLSVTAVYKAAPTAVPSLHFRGYQNGAPSNAYFASQPPVACTTRPPSECKFVLQSNSLTQFDEIEYYVEPFTGQSSTRIDLSILKNAVQLSKENATNRAQATGTSQQLQTCSDSLTDANKTSANLQGQLTQCQQNNYPHKISLKDARVAGSKAVFIFRLDKQGYVTAIAKGSSGFTSAPVTSNGFSNEERIEFSGLGTGSYTVVATVVNSVTGQVVGAASEKPNTSKKPSRRTQQTDGQRQPPVQMTDTDDPRLKFTVSGDQPPIAGSLDISPAGEDGANAKVELNSDALALVAVKCESQPDPKEDLWVACDGAKADLSDKGLLDEFGFHAIRNLTASRARVFPFQKLPPGHYRFTAVGIDENERPITFLAAKTHDIAPPRPALAFDGPIIIKFTTASLSVEWDSTSKPSQAYFQMVKPSVPVGAAKFEIKATVDTATIAQPKDGKYHLTASFDSKDIPSVLAYAKDPKQPAPILHVHMEDDRAPKADILLQLGFQPVVPADNKTLSKDETQSLQQVVDAVNDPQKRKPISWSQILATGLGLFLRGI